MVFRETRNWLRPISPSIKRKPQARANLSQRRRYYRPTLDNLEDRRLLSVSPATDEPVTALVAPQVQLAPEIVGRYVFYNNSRYDGRDPAASAADDNAIAPDKQALFLGETPSYSNYTSYSAGINGIMVDIADLSGVPTAADFVFQVGVDNNPSNWSLAPEPLNISVRAGAGLDGSSRVTIVWADDAIENQWLEVNVRPTANTGLQQPDVFFFGNLTGSSNIKPNDPVVTYVDAEVTTGKTYTNGNLAPLVTTYDYDRDGLVNSSDELIARNHFGTVLPYITPGTDFVWGEVAARHIFYNHSSLDGSDPAANAGDDAAVDSSKAALLPGGDASPSNYTDYAEGINGIMVDIANLAGVPTASDFDFRMGNSNDLSQWVEAPAPTVVGLRPGEGADGSDRVTVIWADGAIVNTWLQVTVKATAVTHLAVADTFYFGNVSHASQGSSGEPGPAVSSPLSLITPTPIGNVAAQPPSSEVIFTDFVEADVVGRYVFYNNSQFDGNSASADANDGAAIAPDKQALLPGQTADFSNYTSYTRGINGIMVDIAGLPDVPTAEDFDFLTGTSPDVSEWVGAPEPTSVTVRQGAGVDGSTRVTVVWPDGLIRDTWLQVTVQATTRTGLDSPDVFYFGNLVGESGDEADQARVVWPDLTGAFSNPSAISQPSPITSPYDYNRDSLVNGTDELSTLPMPRELPLITAPEVVVEPEPVRQQPELFAPGDANFAVSFAPNLARAVDGTLLAFAQGRYGFDDQMSHALNMRRSTDGGATWSATETIFSVAPNGIDIVGPPSPIVDEVTGEIFLLFTLRDLDVYVMSSTDNGLTWSSPKDITSDVKVTASSNPNPAAFPSDPWGWIAIGPTHGIQIKNGPYAGRLIIASDHRLSSDRRGPSWSHVTYSDDHGQTWHLGGGLDQTNPTNNHSNEAALVELSDGSLYMNIRKNNAWVRGDSRSDDGGMTWSTMALQTDIATQPVSGSLLRVNENTILFAAPDNAADSMRRQMTIWVSQDDGASWSKSKPLTFDYAGYSDMVLVGPDTVMIAYNAGHTDGFSADYVSLARFNLRWLLNDDPEQFTWYFNEQAPGAKANIVGTTIQDASDWEIRSGARATSPADAPLYVAGVHAGDSALALTNGTDYVQLTPTRNGALQFDRGENFTVEMVMRTTDSSGVVIGTLPNETGWTLELVDGFLQISLTDDASVTETVTNSQRINDGAWHRITVLRNNTLGVGRTYIYVDGAFSALGFSALGSLRSAGPVTLGAYNDGSEQLALQIDTLRITRAALPAAEFLSNDLVAPPRFEPPGFAANAPTSIDGLQLWLPAYDPAHFFSGLHYSDPLPLDPNSTTAAQSAYDASGNGYMFNTGSESRELFYDYDPIVGASWRFDGDERGGGERWIVQNPDNAGSNNFDFVQNTGVFTLSTFIKADTPTGYYMSLFDTNVGTGSNYGFDFSLGADGSLGMAISGPNQTRRAWASTVPGLVAQDVWYHVAAVGNGPGRPVTFYVTPVTSSTVTIVQSNGEISGPNGVYPTAPGNNLSIGGRARIGLANFNGNMVDQAIYNRALSAQEIQQLFDYTKKP